MDFEPGTSTRPIWGLGEASAITAAGGTSDLSVQPASPVVAGWLGVYPSATAEGIFVDAIEFGDDDVLIPIDATDPTCPSNIFWPTSRVRQDFNRLVKPGPPVKVTVRNEHATGTPTCIVDCLCKVDDNLGIEAGSLPDARSLPKGAIVSLGLIDGAVGGTKTGKPDTNKRIRAYHVCAQADQVDGQLTVLKLGDADRLTGGASSLSRLDPEQPYVSLGGRIIDGTTKLTATAASMTSGHISFAIVGTIVE